MEFFSTAAQVIPVLFLVLAFQMRGNFSPDPIAAMLYADPQVAQENYEQVVEGVWHARLATAFSLCLSLIGLSLMAVGEAVALHALHKGRAPSAAAEWVWIALAFGGAAVVLPLVYQHAFALHSVITGKWVERYLRRSQ